MLLRLDSRHFPHPERYAPTPGSIARGHAFPRGEGNMGWRGHEPAHYAAIGY